MTIPDLIRAQRAVLDALARVNEPDAYVMAKAMTDVETALQALQALERLAMHRKGKTK